MRFNHRLANPDEWQTVKPIAVKAIYIPIVSLFWETIKNAHDTERDDQPGVKLIKSSVAIIRSQIGLIRELRKITLRLSFSLTHTYIHTHARARTHTSTPRPTFLDCYVVTGAMQMSHDSLATVSLRNKNVNVLVAFGWNSLRVARLQLWKGVVRDPRLHRGSLQHLDSSPRRVPRCARRGNPRLGSGTWIWIWIKPHQSQRGGGCT